jgi:type IV secretion system protein VirB9
MKRSLLAWTALSSALCLLAPAQAADYPHPTRKDTRSLEVNYDPGNIIPIWSAPGSVLLIRFAEDEAIFKVKTADSEHLGGGFVANLLTWKFKGCFVPQPAFVFTHKGAAERVYAFEVETKPQICDTDKPAPPSTAVASNDGVTNISVSSALPDLHHLEHPDDLAGAGDGGNGGHIPYMLTIRYPADEAAKRAAAARAAAERRRQEDAALLVKTATWPWSPNNNTAYWGLGEPDMKPSRAVDNGYTTMFVFPQMQSIPTVTKLGNPSVRCGENDAKESTTDFDVKGDTMTIAGTARAWCLRSNGRVYEVWNSNYSPTGQTPGTGSASPYVQRVVNGH